jgi:hypothetical protein
MLDHDLTLMEQLDAKDPLSVEDLTKLDRLTDKYNA